MARARWASLRTQVDRAALGEVAVDALARPRWPRRRRRSPAWPGASPAWPRCPCWRASAASERGEQRRAPAAVAPGRTEARHLALEHGDPQRGVGQQQRRGRPQPGEPGADDADVDVEVLGERGARRQRDRDGLPPEGEALVARCRPRSLHPPPRLGQTPRGSVEAMKSISSWPQISGGDSCTTGSPRSSARQIRPASNSAPDRKPRSRRSDSSSSKDAASPCP